MHAQEAVATNKVVTASCASRDGRRAQVRRSCSRVCCARQPLIWQIVRCVDHDPDELERCIARVTEGDHDAFATLYDRLSPTVFGVVRRVLRDPAQAEEVTQEAFVEVWRHADRFDATRAGVRTWVVTIAHRRAVDRVRSEQAHRDRHARTAAHAMLSPDGPADAAVADDERSRALIAMRELSAPQREALELAFYEGLTHVQIADKLGVALGTVKTRIRDGLLRLRALMGVRP